MPANDPFSQLSLSRGPSGDAPHQQYGAPVHLQPSNARLPQLSSSGSGTSAAWQSNAASKGLVSLAPGKQSGVGAQPGLNGVASVNRSSSSQPQPNQPSILSLI